MVPGFPKLAFPSIAASVDPRLALRSSSRPVGWEAHEGPREHKTLPRGTVSAVTDSDRCCLVTPVVLVAVGRVTFTLESRVTSVTRPEGGGWEGTGVGSMG